MIITLAQASGQTAVAAVEVGASKPSLAKGAIVAKRADGAHGPPTRRRLFRRATFSHQGMERERPTQLRTHCN
jgi:hypothetical protein